VNEQPSIYETHIAPIQRRMVNSIWRIVRDPDDVDDVLQEVLLRLLRRVGQVERHPNPTALILRTCVNAAIDHLRRGRSRNQALRSLGDSLPVMSGPPSPREVLVRRQQAEEVRMHLRHLPRREAEAIVLVVLEDLTYPEIASSMGCSESTVRVLVSKARKRLQTRFTLGGVIRVTEVEQL
jgi:RNA polymerase sigma-70 factor, ECF subfamily